ncbi:MAG: aminotransferase class I/II-fold pyridoxal phosphate-dependent enzyme [Kiritimatiellae bacterium]|nr:aminotransferase class I/II-fold pyridoxal phosphate-dependent enzyme [Kiritimatiellia bacterium]
MTTGSKSLRDFISPTVRDLPRSGIRDFFDIVATRDDVISLGIGEPDFTTPWHIREKAIYSLERGATHYTSNLGLAALRRAICAYVASSYKGLAYDWRNEVLVTVGVSEALDAVLRAIIVPGDEIVYHEPCFVAYPSEIKLAGGVPVPVPTRAEDGFRLTREALEAAVTPRTKALLVNFPCNPTGAVLDVATARMIADFVTEHDILLISDEVYSELTYDVERVSPMTIPGIRDRAVFLSGFSKAWAMTGFRLGFVCAPRELVEAAMKIHQYAIMCAPTVCQHAAVEALENGAADTQAMLDSYHARRNFISDAFARMDIPCVRPQGAFYAFPSIVSTGLSSYDFAMGLLDEEAVACVPGNAFGACGEGFVRCSYATGMGQLEEAMARFARFVGRHRK